jgi:hypothetical protein
MNSMSTDAPDTKQPLLPVTCDCKHIEDIVIPMELWSIHIGHEETNDLLARRKVGMSIDVRARRHCGNCHECMEYRKWLSEIPVEKGGSAAPQLEFDPQGQGPNISCFEIYVATSRAANLSIY